MRDFCALRGVAKYTVNPEVITEISEQRGIPSKPRREVKGNPKKHSLVPQESGKGGKRIKNRCGCLYRKHKSCQQSRGQNGLNPQLGPRARQAVPGGRPNRVLPTGRPLYLWRQEQAGSKGREKFTADTRHRKPGGRTPIRQGGRGGGASPGTRSSVSWCQGSN